MLDNAQLSTFQHVMPFQELNHAVVKPDLFAIIIQNIKLALVEQIPFGVNKVLN